MYEVPPTTLMVRNGVIEFFNALSMRDKLLLAEAPTRIVLDKDHVIYGSDYVLAAIYVNKPTIRVHYGRNN